MCVGAAGLTGKVNMKKHIRSVAGVKATSACTQPKYYGSSCLDLQLVGSLYKTAPRLVGHRMVSLYALL